MKRRGVKYEGRSLKRAKIDEGGDTPFPRPLAEGEEDRSQETVIAQFVDQDGEPTGPKLSLPRGIQLEQLQQLINNHILKNEETLPYSFFVNENEIKKDLHSLLLALNEATNDEDVLKIVYQPQAVFRVRQVTRCTSTLEGHTEAILAVAFSPDGKRLATGSGDTTVRLWDVETGTPYAECKGHMNWVLTVAWSPDGTKLISGSMDNTIRQWDPVDGRLLQTYAGHKGYVTSLSWEPLHKNPKCERFMSSSKDATCRMWQVGRKIHLNSFNGHSLSVTCVKWGGEGLIYSASNDLSIICWTDEGKVVRILKGHAHWVNTLSLNTDYVLRTGALDHTGKTFEDPLEAQKRALERYKEVVGNQGEILVSGSDDATAIIWHPSKQKTPVERLTGHGKLINIVSFSPDGNLFATASFDKNIKLWSKTGKHLTTFRGHVSEVYQLSWSSDSRMFVSGSKDSTMKVWDCKKLKMAIELPGHADEVFSVDWSPDGAMVASGSKDRMLKLWRN